MALCCACTTQSAFGSGKSDDDGVHEDNAMVGSHSNKPTHGEFNMYQNKLFEGGH